MNGSRFVLNTELAAAKVFDGEAIVINVVTGRYYDLEGTGALAWTLLTAGASVDEAADALSQRFEVDVETARGDLEALVQRLLAEELIVADGDAAAPAPATDAPSVRAPYFAPTLVTYSDMEELLTVDPPLPAGYTPDFPSPVEASESGNP
jgi:hypothetical protein